MAFELQNMTGTMFQKEDRKENQPNYDGLLNINGELYQIAEWERIGKNSGKPYKYLKATYKGKANAGPVNNYQQPAQQQAAQPAVYSKPNEPVMPESDLPF